MTTTPGLDVAELRRRRRPRHNRTLILERIADHLDEFDGYASFSGGKDSLVVVDMVREVEPNAPIVFFDSGLEFPETYAYLHEVADAWNLRLEVIPADPPLLQALIDTGGWDIDRPTVSLPYNLHDVLIARPAGLAHETHGPGETWGVRADESVRGSGRWALYHRALTDEIARQCRGCCTDHSGRRARHGGIVHRADGTHVLGPLWNWSTGDVWDEIARRSLPVNPVYAKLRQLGAPERALRVSHVIDGNFLDSGRATWLRRGWPDLFEQVVSVLPRLRTFV